jgi:hypothetical protein
MASPAGAVDYPDSWPGELCTQNHEGCGAFAAAGDYVGAFDFLSDGRSTVTRWETDYGRSGVCIDSNGTGNGWTDCNYDFSETASLRFKVCLRNYSNDIGWINCSDWSEWLSISDGTPQ